MRKAFAALAFVAIAAGLAYFWRKSENSPALAPVTPAIAIPHAPPAPPAPISSPIREPDSFTRKLKAVEAALPTLEQIHALPAEQKHRAPKPVVSAAIELGGLAEDIEKNPSHAPEALEFYGKCARRADLATAIRAACLASLRELAKKTGAEADEAGIPASLRDLTDGL
jgi:hypothetical protein